MIFYKSIEDNFFISFVIDNKPLKINRTLEKRLFRKIDSFNEITITPEIIEKFISLKEISDFKIKEEIQNLLFFIFQKKLINNKALSFQNNLFMSDRFIIDVSSLDTVFKYNNENSYELVYKSGNIMKVLFKDGEFEFLKNILKEESL